MKQAEDELTAAAEHIRDLISAATFGPWQTGHSWAGDGIAVMGPDGQPVALCGEGMSAADEAAYIAFWHPGTAVLVAELLEGMAAHWKDRPIDDLATYLMSPACKLARHITGRTT